IPKPKELVSASFSGTDSDSEVDRKLKQKKQVTPEKPVKPKTGETSSRDDNYYCIFGLQNNLLDEYFFFNVHYEKCSE
uniref:Uncharacterized protein n=1 Tax=Panthera leo TaxID=9689 RepID=A0A8C9D2G4_PANLE